MAKLNAEYQEALADKKEIRKTNNRMWSNLEFIRNKVALYEPMVQRLANETGVVISSESQKNMSIFSEASLSQKHQFTDEQKRAAHFLQQHSKEIMDPYLRHEANMIDQIANRKF